jgi:hypothetical protein
LSASQLQQSVAFNHEAVPGDYERLSKSLFTSFSESGQLGGRNGELMPKIAGMRVEFVQTTGYELARNVIQLSSCLTS